MTDISSYEKLRLENIQRNELFLEKLDLAPFKRKTANVEVPKLRTKKAKTVHLSSENSETGPRRLSSRNVSKAPGFFSEDSLFRMNKSKDDSDEDYTDEEESLLVSTKQVQRSKKELSLLSDIEEQESVIKIEKAKTGRSSCRKCRENIEEDTMRVGMKAWIMGRSSWTWSHPACFSSLIALNRDSGRGKCKVTSSRFDANEIKVTCSSHTATVNMCIAAAAMILGDVLREDPTYSISNLIATLDDISTEEESAIREAFQSSSTLKNAIAPAENSIKHCMDNEKSNLPRRDQPVAGVVTGTKGQVAWKFAGHTCYGILIPKSETETHCFAKTHKGNVKTLSKGLQSWWLLGDESKS